MARSMTAYAQAGQGIFSWEIRSVNQRYLDLNFRMPDALRRLEPALRMKVRDYLHRGKVDCTLKTSAEAAAGYDINNEAVDALLTSIKVVDQKLGAETKPTALDVMRWPGVVNTEDVADNDADALTSFEVALKDLVKMRESEGDKLADIILAQLDELTTVVAQVRDEAPVILAAQMQKLRSRIDELDVDTDPGRLEQELVMMAQKADVQEEIDRLGTHVQAVKDVLGGKGAIGRRLDFLMQELNREANTLSSKASAAATSLQAVDLKVLIEQMREQVQNIE